MASPVIQDPPREEDLVWSEDPKVDVPAHLKGCGWVPLEECTDKPGAEVLRVRRIRPGERTTGRDLWARKGEAAMHVYTARCMVIAVNRNKAPAKIAAHLDHLELSDVIKIDLLAKRGFLRARGVDPSEGYAVCREALGYPPLEPVEEEGAEAEGGEGAEEGTLDGDPKSERG